MRVMGAGRRRAAAAADLKWSDALLSSLITLLKVWVPRPGRFSRGLLFQAPCKINQSFIKVHSRHELPNQIEQCFRPVSCYCSIKLSYCWGRWLKCSLPTKDVNVVCVKLEEKKIITLVLWNIPSSRFLFFQVVHFSSLHYLQSVENVLC